MKIIAALKRIKRLDRKIEKNMKLIEKWCSYIEEPGDAAPTYTEEDLRRMMQQNSDWAAEKARLRHHLHATNLETQVEFDGKVWTVDELLCLQNITLPTNLKQLKLLRRKEKSGGGWSSRESTKDSKVIMQYDPKERDKAIDKLENLLADLDETLDDLNMTTNLV